MSRGRGRGGSGLSLTHEQLQAMGISRGDTSTAPTLTPPPLFPKLDTKPLPLPSDSATDYMLIVKDQFIEYLHESPAYVKMRTKNDNIERYSDKYKILALDAKKNNILDCAWAYMPMELRPLTQRGRITSRKRKVDDVNIIAKRLKTLEKKELDESTNNVQNMDESQVKKEGVSDDENVEEEQEQEDDVDDGTDYANNYFDNGEDYDDEDDNLDDDPVY